MNLKVERREDCPVSQMWSSEGRNGFERELGGRVDPVVPTACVLRGLRGTSHSSKTLTPVEVSAFTFMAMQLCI